jgi:hypothetical protein
MLLCLEYMVPVVKAFCSQRILTTKPTVAIRPFTSRFLNAFGNTDKKIYNPV